MRRHFEAWSLCMGLALVMACPAEPEMDDGVADTGDSGSATSASTSSADSGSGSETAGPDCSGFDPVMGTSIEMTVVNGTDAPIFLEQPGCGHPIRLSGPGDAGPTQVGMPECEAPACHELLEGQCAVACPGGAGACQVTVVRVDPGASYSRMWSGSVWVGDLLPLECTPAGCLSECFRRIEASPGTYGITVGYFETCPLDGGVGCECGPGESTCSLPVTGATTGDVVMAEATFDYPIDTMPQLLIE